MRHQKREQRIFQVREVERLAVHLHLVSRQIDRHVVDGDVIRGGALVARPQKLANAGGTLLGGRAVHHEVRLDLYGKAELGQLRLVHDNEHRRGTVFHQKRLSLRHRVERIATRFVNHQVMRWMLGEQLLELRRRTCHHVNIEPREHGLELMGVVEAVGDEKNRLPLHHGSTFPACRARI